jgi:hypothetical protein
MWIEFQLAKGCCLYEIWVRVGPTERDGHCVAGDARQEKENNGLVRFED